MAINSEDSDELLHFLGMTEGNIDDLVNNSCRAADIPVIVNIVKDELQSARNALNLISPGIEKTEKARRINELEEKCLEWEKGRNK